MGGRVAEELSQDDITTGAGNDIERATELARKMVCDWGMSDLGPLSFGGNDEPIFLGRDFAQQTSYSEETSKAIDQAIKDFIDDGHKKATEILTEHSDVLDRLAQELLENEVLEGGEIYALIEEMTGRDLHRSVAPIRTLKPVSEEENEAPVSAAAASVAQTTPGSGERVEADEEETAADPTASPEVAPAQRSKNPSTEATPSGEPLPSPKTQR